MNKLLLIFVIAILAGGGGYAYWLHAGQSTTEFRTVAVKKGDLMVAISATGTVEPEEVVDVGAQVAGRITEFGTDPGSGKVVDYGSAVDENAVLARIDESLYQSDVEQTAAQLEQAKANVLRAKADLEQMKAKYVQAEQNWKRAQELGPSRALSATDYDNYQAMYETAKATVGVGEATVLQAEKTVAQNEANLKRSQTNLGYCTIRSPVKGVIVDRRVNIGQTVVSSLSAPSLFLIAKDLRRLQVWASVNEADIGRIHPGQPVTFTVDAYPGETFHGKVGKVRLNATMTQNVVTYTVEIQTDNPDGKLLPYLTANVQFEVAERKDVLMVPNAALRWMPLLEQISPDARQEADGNRRGGGANGRGGSGGAGGEPRGPAGTTSRPTSGPARDGRTRGTVWIQDGEFVRPVPVRTGLSDGAMTEIEGDRTTEGLAVVVGEQERTAASNDQTKNPFIPQMFRNRRQ